MSSKEDVLRLDPALRIAIEIGKQAGISPKVMGEWYSQVCLGELSIGEMLLRIEAGIKDQALKQTFTELRRKLPEFK